MFINVTLKFYLGFCLLFLYKGLTFSELDKYGLVVSLHWPKSLLLQETKSVRCSRKTQTIFLANPLSTFNFFLIFLHPLPISPYFVSWKNSNLWEVEMVISVLYQFSSVQLLSRVRLFVTPWITASQASLPITNSWSSLKVISIESVMPSSHLILVIPFSYCLQSFPASGSFPMSQLFSSGGQSIGISASASVLPMTIQD